MIRTNVFIPQEMLDRLKKAKAVTGIPVAEFIRRAIEAALQQAKL